MRIKLNEIDLAWNALNKINKPVCVVNTENKQLSMLSLQYNNFKQVNKLDY